MADNVSDALKNLDKQIKNVEQSLSTMMQRYERFQRAASTGDATKMQQAWNSLQTGANTTAAKLRTLEKEIKNLKAQTKDPASLRRLDKLFRQLNSASSAWASVLASVNRGQQTTQVFAERLARAFEKGQRALAAFNNEQVRGAAASNEMKQGLAGMLPLLQRIGYAFGIAFSVQGLVQFGKKLVETRGEFELQQVALRSILQNKQLADEIWDKTMQAALQSPFTAMQLTTYTKQLAAYRIETDKLFDTTKRLADVSAGLGVDMQRLILAYGQVKAANYLRASEIRQFTEAGVNILGELSTYLSATRGELISTAQVMDMVQKRMVKFEDVEAIFKRMTDEGGIFYNMQYVQSQTVKGQINKLHDAYDQMLNSIGKANTGVLRDMVSLMLNIVQNWRVWKNVIGAIALPTLTIALVKFGKGLATVGSSARIASEEIYGLELAGTKLRRTFGATAGILKKFGGVFGALGITAVIAVITAIISRIEVVKAEMDAVNEKLQRNFDTQLKLKEYNATLEENNKLIKSGTLSEDELKKKRQENSEILATLKEQYPDIIKDRQIERNGVIDLTKEIKAYNDELERELILTASITNKGNWWQKFWNDTDAGNIKEYVEDLNNQYGDMIRVQTAAKSELLELHKQGIDSGEAVDALNRIKNLELSDMEGAVKEYEKIISEAEERTWSFVEILGIASGAIASPLGLAKHLIQHYTKDAGTYENADVVYGLPKVTQFNWDSKQVQSALENSEPLVKDAIEGSVKSISDFSSTILEKYTTKVGDSSVQNISSFIGENSKVITDKINAGQVDVFKTIRNVAETQLGITTDVGRAWFNKWINEIYGITEKRNKKLAELQAQGVGLVAAMATIDKEMPLYDVWAGVGKTTNGNTVTDNDGNGKIDSEWRRRIQLLEEMKKRYDELSESAYGYAKSNTTVREEFKKSWDKIFGGVLSMDAIRFMTDEDMESAFETLLSKAVGASEAIKEELQKKSDSYGAKKPIEIAVRVREDFGKQIEQMFNNYDLTLDLEKLSLPTGELSGIFDFDITTLKDIRKQIDSFYNEKIALGEDPKKLEKQMEGYYKKIDEMERKSLIDRLKKYTQYLTQGRDDAVQIHLEELKAMSELDELYAKGYYTRVQYQSISDKIRKETNEKLSKNEWKEFKESEYYVTMFEDLSNVADDSIDLMLSKLKVLKGRLKDLDPTQVKEIVNSIEKLEKTQRERSPLKTFLNDFRTQREWRQNYDKNINKLGLYSDNESTWLAVRDSLREEVASLTQEYNKLSLDGILGNEKDTKEKLDRRQEQLDYVNKVLEEIRSNIAEINKENNEGYGAWQRTYKGIAVGAQFMSDMASNVGTISTEMLDMFDGVDDATKKLSHDIAEIAGNVGLLVKDIVDAIKSKGTDVGAMIDGLVRTWNIIKGAMSASEAGINRTIERETNSLRDLEESLDRVQRARDKAWDVEMVRQSEREIEEAIYSQIEAYDALIAAESQRKNPDDENLRQWRNEREELYQKLEEERERFIQEFGGIGESGYLSAAQNFVDAWKQAFLETGDGLQGLQDHFDEFLQEWFVKQATMRIAGKMLEPVFRQIDRSVDEYGTGGTSAMLSEIQNVREMAAAIFPDLSLALEDLAGMFGVDGEGSLSGLAAGIQGMTEEQANILEAYWNSVRMYTASIDSNVSRIAEILGAGGMNTNPQLSQLQLIQENTRAMSNLLSATTKSGHPQGGYGIKVFND